MTVIDINIDAGESYGAWRMGDDAGTFPHATSVNLACGFHGGDPASMFAAARLALEHGLAIGAHPGLPDLVGFGRRALQVTPEQAYGDVVYQVGALARRARRARRDAAPRQAARRVLDARERGRPGRRRRRAAGDARHRSGAAARRHAGIAARARGRRDRPPERARGVPGARLRAQRPARAARHARARSSRTSTRPRAGRCGWRSRARWRRSTARRCRSGRARSASTATTRTRRSIAAAVRAALEAAGVELAAF